MDFLEIQFWKLAIWIIKKGYGANCETSDLKDFSEKYTKPEEVFHRGRCPSCRAKEVIDWIEEHIILIKL